MSTLLPTRDELREVARLREGTLQSRPFPVLLQALALEERTAVLEIRRRQLTKRIVIEDGVPIECRSNLVHETLGRFLVGIGRISEEQFTAAHHAAISAQRLLGEVLVEQGVLGSYELFRLLQQNLAKKLLDGFTWRDGEFRLLFDVPDVSSPLKVKVPQLIVFGITRFSQQEEADAAAGSLVGRPLVLNPNAAVALEDIRLSPQQEKLTACLGAGRRIDELAAASGLPFEDVTRLLYALALLEVVLPADQVKRAPRPAAAPPPPATTASPPAPGPAPATTTGSGYVFVGSSLAAGREAVAPPPAASPPAAAASPAPAPAAATSAAPLSPAEAERRREELMQAYLVYRQQDPFDLLGLPETAAPSAIHARYLEVARRWAFWTWPAELQPLAERGQDLFLAAARAYATLCDTEQRNALVFRRKTLRDERSRPKAVDMTIKTDLLDSELQFRKGRALMEASRFKEALQLLEFASDCDPQNGLYRAELGWCRFRQAPNLPRGALKEVKEATRLDPKCGLAWYYAGELHKLLNEFGEAEAAYQKAIKLMAPDRRPIDALRELGTKKR